MEGGSSGWVLQDDTDFTRHLQIRSGILKDEPQLTVPSAPLKPTSPAQPHSQISEMFLKCKDCPFLTISHERFDKHQTEEHQEYRPHLINCPGCSNSFATRTSLDAHLVNDHKVDSEEIVEILNIVDPPAPTKSRIYIKSVDVLRNPSFSDRPEPNEDNFPPQPVFESSPLGLQMPIDLVDLCDLTHEEECFNSVTAPTSNTVTGLRQKIYLKNVNELQQQQTHLFSSEFDQFQAMAFQPQISFPIPTPTPPPLTPVLVPSPQLPPEDQTDQLPLISFSPEQQLQDYPAPKNKIYIRNVQTLIRPEVQELVTDDAPAPASSYRHLSSINMELEEVQSLPPQRNDIVVLDDFHEEIRQEGGVELHHQEADLFEVAPVVPNSPLSDCVDECAASEALKVITEIQSFGGEQAGNAFMGLFLATSLNNTACDSDSAFHYKNLEEELPLQMVQGISSGGQGEGELASRMDGIELDTGEGDERITLVQPKNDAMALGSRQEASFVDTVISLADESEGEENHSGIQQAIPLPQMPRIYVSNYLSETPPSVPAISNRSQKPRGRPRGGRNYAADGTSSFAFPCSTPGCPRRFREEANLIYHQRCHDPENQRAICPECDQKQFANWTLLHSHLWRQHSIDMELYSCTLCNFKTPCLSSLRNTHEKTHSAKKDFQCESCPSAFKNRKQLKNHRRHHRLSKVKKSEESVKKWICTTCYEAFEKSTLLKKHVRQAHHRPEAAEKEELKLEIGKIFKCDQCPYETMHRNSAKRHRMVHNGEKKYKCPACEYSCIQSNSFRAHLLKIHPEQAIDLIFKCPHCPFTTINKVQLGLHLKSKHEGQG